METIEIKISQESYDTLLFYLDYIKVYFNKNATIDDAIKYLDENEQKRQ